MSSLNLLRKTLHVCSIVKWISFISFGSKTYYLLTKFSQSKVWNSKNTISDISRV